MNIAQTRAVIADAVQKTGRHIAISQILDIFTSGTTKIQYEVYVASKPGEADSVIETFQHYIDALNYIKERSNE